MDDWIFITSYFIWNVKKNKFYLILFSRWHFISFSPLLPCSSPSSASSPAKELSPPPTIDFAWERGRALPRSRFGMKEKGRAVMASVSSLRQKPSSLSLEEGERELSHLSDDGNSELSPRKRGERAFPSLSRWQQWALSNAYRLPSLSSKKGEALSLSTPNLERKREGDRQPSPERESALSIPDPMKRVVLYDERRRSAAMTITVVGGW